MISCGGTDRQGGLQAPPTTEALYEGPTPVAVGRHQGWHTNGGISGGGSKGYEGRQSGRTVGHVQIRLGGMSVGGNTQEGSGEEKAGALGWIGTT